MKRFLVIVAMSGAAGLVHGAAAAQRGFQLDDRFSVTEVSQPQLSPDGRRVAFQQRRTDLESNRYEHELLVVAASGSGAPRRLFTTGPVRSSGASLMARWAPDSRRIAFFKPTPEGSQIWQIDVDTGAEQPLTRTAGARAGFDGQVMGTVSDFKWSPDGRSIAFTVGSRTGESPDGESLIGYAVEPAWRPHRPVVRSVGVLCVLDASSGAVRRLTEPPFNVHSFDWSPRGDRLAVSGSFGAGWDAYMRTDVFLLDVDGGTPRPLVQQNGRDSDPVWSPDGGSIAFASQMGTLDWEQDTTIGVVPAGGGDVVYPARRFREEVAGTPRGLQWSADGAWLYFEAPVALTHQLFRVPVRGGSAVRVSDSAFRYHTGFTYSADRTTVALTIESVTQPPDVYISTLQPFAPRRLTDANAHLRDIKAATVDVIRWRSGDARWDISGVLVTPPDAKPGQRSPLLVLVEGGPQMVRLRYDLSSQYPIQALAARGFAILAPNTRGRDGHGLSFSRAIATERGHGIGPLNDVLSGVDAVVARGIADPSRLGIFGFSYGAYLTAFAITQTDRFKAASLMDGATNLVYSAYQTMGEDVGPAFFRQLAGFDPPYHDDGLRALVRQSPIHHVRHVKTPTLLEYGELSHAPDHGRMFFHALRYHDVPCEFIVYPRTGHGLTEPRLRLDSMRRNIAWFERWVLQSGPDRTP